MKLMLFAVLLIQAVVPVGEWSGLAGLAALAGGVAVIGVAVGYRIG